MAQQLTFDWPVGVSLGADDFFISTANTTAYRMVRDQTLWPQRKLVLVGPPACGKSHLARLNPVALVFDATGLPADLPSGNSDVVVEDMQDLPASAQEAMFHLHNHMQHGGGTLLMTARTPPARWPVSLPDLASRVQGATVTTIDDPDDALLQALVMKHFADRQIVPTPALLDYVGPRIERSFAAVADFVARLDALALSEKRAPTPQLARRLLDN